jgi:hypothetical protein
MHEGEEWETGPSTSKGMSWDFTMNCDNAQGAKILFRGETARYSRQR